MTQVKGDDLRRNLTRICAVENGICWITLDRPHKANAVSSSLLADILGAMDAAEAQPDVHAVVLSGAGHHFCAGADLAELLEGGAVAFRRLLDNFRDVCLKFERSPLPVVAMVHGAARAGGLELMLCCDAVVAADSATIGDAHALRNLLPGGGNSVRLPRTIGHQRAKWMILSGAAITAAQGAEWGIVTRVTTQENLRQAAIELAGEVSVAHRDTIERAKSLLFHADALGFEAALENEIVTLEQHAASDALQRSLNQFVKH